MILFMLAFATTASADEVTTGSVLRQLGETDQEMVAQMEAMQQQIVTLQTKADAGDAEAKRQIADLQAQVAELKAKQANAPAAQSTPPSFAGGVMVPSGSGLEVVATTDRIPGNLSGFAFQELGSVAGYDAYVCVDRGSWVYVAGPGAEMLSVTPANNGVAIQLSCAPATGRIYVPGLADGDSVDLYFVVPDPRGNPYYVVQAHRSFLHGPGRGMTPVAGREGTAQPVPKPR